MGLDKCVMICTHHCSIILANFIALKILCAVSLSLFPSSGNYWSIYYLCCCSVAKLFPTLCNSMDCSFPGFPVLRNLLEFAQIHVHWVSDAIQPSHLLNVSVQSSSVQLLSHVRLLGTPWTAAHQASLSIANSRRLPKRMSIESVMLSNHLILCCPLLILCPKLF